MTSTVYGRNIQVTKIDLFNSVNGKGEQTCLSNTKYMYRHAIILLLDVV